MKRAFLIAVFIVMAAAGCSSASKSSTASYIKIIEKGTTDKQYWVMAVNPYYRQEQQFKMLIDNPNTWNLIEKDQEYFATYEYVSLDKRVDLLSIKHPSKPNP